MRFYFEVLANNGARFAVESPEVTTMDEATRWVQSNPSVLEFEQIDRGNIPDDMLHSMRPLA